VIVHSAYTVTMTPIAKGQRMADINEAAAKLAAFGVTVTTQPVKRETRVVDPLNRAIGLLAAAKNPNLSEESRAAAMARLGTLLDSQPELASSVSAVAAKQANSGR